MDGPISRKGRRLPALRALCCLIWLLAGTGTARAQPAIVPTPVFQSYNTDNGLPDVRIRNLFQDSQGYLWVGTMNGTCRYDGYSFQRSFPSAGAGPVLDHWAYAITEDAAHRIWFGTREGIGRYDAGSEQFTQVRGLQQGDHPLLARGVTALYGSAANQLWIGTPLGLLVYDIASARVVDLPLRLQPGPVSALLPSGPDALWIAGQDGVTRYHTRSQEAERFPLRVRPNPYGDRIWSLLEADGALLVATASDGLLRIPVAPGAPGYGVAQPHNRFRGGSLDNEQVFDIVRSASGTLWLATEHGLAKIEGPKGGEALTVYRHNPVSNKSLSNNIAYTVLIDRDDNLWCGTESGLNKLNLDRLAFQYYTFADKDLKDRMRGIGLAPDGALWLGTADHGLLRYDGQRGSTTPAGLPADRNVRSLLVDAQGIWSGTLNGLSVASPGGGSFRRGIPGRAVFALLRDRAGGTWVGTNKGLVHIGTGSDTTYYDRVPGVDPALRNGFIRFLFEDASGRLWLGLENGGFGLFDAAAGTYRPVTDAAGRSLPVSHYLGITEYPQDVFWVGSAAGLTRVTLKGAGFEVKAYTEADGLPGRSVNSVLADGLGSIWLGLLNGMARFDTRAGTFHLYLRGIEFGGNAATRLPDGRLLFGANDGFVLFHPGQVRDPGRPPTVRFTELRLLNRPVHPGAVFEGDTVLRRPLAATEEVRLNYRNNVFTIGFVGLQYADPGQTRYSYQLQGFDKGWIETDAANRNITYTNLDDGDYVFRVRAATTAGKWSEPALLRLTVLPPPWKTWWAKLLYFVAFNALLFGIYRYLQVQSRQRTQLRLEQMEKEQIRRINEMKTTFFTDISHEFRTPLSLIVSPVEELMAAPEIEGEARVKLRMIHNNCRKLLSLIAELMTFQKMEEDRLQLVATDSDIAGFAREVFRNFEPLAARNGIHYHFRASAERLVVSFDRPKLEIVLNNLLSNAFKFTPAGGSITFDLHLQDDGHLLLRISDSGRGFSRAEGERLFERFFSQHNAQGTGVGLYLTRKIVELHGGTIRAESAPDVRTDFTVTLPVQVLESGAGAEAVPEAYQPEFVTTMPAVPDPAEGEEPAEKPVLLLVEDNPEVLDYLELLFRNEYTIRKAENGIAALESLKTELPDLVISDVSMPGMDGITLCRAIKGAVETSHLQVILLTARATIGDKMDGLHSGADDYIAKPFHPEILRVKARNLVESRRRLIERYRSEAPGPVPVAVAENPLDKEFLENVYAAIEARLGDDDFGVEELGKAVFMSRSHLFRKLKALTGQNPLDVIYGVRLKKGLELLLARKSSISSIAYEVGFKSPSAFSASFKKQYGKTPSDYLNSLISGQDA